MQRYLFDVSNGVPISDRINAYSVQVKVFYFPVVSEIPSCTWLSLLNYLTFENNIKIELIKEHIPLTFSARTTLLVTWHNQQPRKWWRSRQHHKWWRNQQPHKWWHNQQPPKWWRNRQHRNSLRWILDNFNYHTITRPESGLSVYIR